MVKKPKKTRERYAILVNGEVVFYINAISEPVAAIKAQGDERYLRMVRENRDKVLILNAKRVRDITMAIR